MGDLSVEVLSPLDAKGAEEVATGDQGDVPAEGDDGGLYQKKDYKFRLLIYPNINVGYGAFYYGKLSKDVRYVPPHPDDPGSGTEAINPKDDTLKQDRLGYPQLGFDVDFVFEFVEAVYLKYGFGMAWFLSESDHYPPWIRQRYATHENAYTYLNVGGTISYLNRIGIGFPLKYIKTEHDEHRFALDLGLYMRTIEVERGWDRYASTEVQGTKSDTLFGGYLDFNYDQMLPMKCGFLMAMGAGLRFQAYEGGVGFSVLMKLIPIGLHISK